VKGALKTLSRSARRGRDPSRWRGEQVAVERPRPEVRVSREGEGERGPRVATRMRGSGA